jgi:hypothetical protein
MMTMSKLVSAIHDLSALSRETTLLKTAIYTSIITGFSINPLNAPISTAPSAPSTAR